MRLWVHLIWLETNPQTTLQIAGPKEDRKLEDFIRNWDEATAALAWHLYVNSSPRAYNLEAVNHVDKYVPKDGKNIMARQVADQSAITRFPLSAFLATSEGYAVQAKLHFDKLFELRKQHGKDWIKHHPAGYEMLAVNTAMKKQVGSLKSKWGAADEKPLENLEEQDVY